jgi:hypothetical protein
VTRGERTAGPPPRRLPRPLRIAIRIAATAVGLPVATWLILYAVASWRLSSALASAREAGLATSLAELAPPPLPAERNAASHFEAAFALHPDPEGKDDILGRALDHGFDAVLGNDEKHVLGILGKSSALFEKLRVGRALGACRYDRPYAGPAFNPVSSQAAPAIRTARYLGLQAQAEAATGRGDAARESVRDLLALADSFRDEPLMISQLVRLAIAGVALEAVHESVTRKTGKEELRVWLDVVPRPESLDGALSLAYRGEFAMGAELAGRPLAEAIAALSPSPEPSPWLARTSLLAPFWKLVGRNHVERMAGLVGKAGCPYPEARAAFGAASEELRFANSYDDLLSRLVIPALEKPLDQLALSQARLAVLRAGLEWEIEFAEKGRYPDAPAGLDPLTGRPLRYDREAGTVSSEGLPGKSAREREEARLVWKLRHPPGK